MVAGDSAGETPRRGILGRLGISLFFGVFLGMGSVFVWLMGRDLGTALSGYRWPKAPCEIRESTVQRDPANRGAPYAYHVLYRLDWNGQTVVSTNAARQVPRYSDYAKAARWVTRYPAGSRAVCYANPTDPSRSVLRRDSLWLALFLPLPLVFVGIGGAGIIWAWRRPQPTEAAVARGPHSDRARAGRASGCLIPFFGVFLVAGLAAFYAIALRPLWLSLAARGWVEVPCRVVASDVQTQSDSEGTTYRVDILYAYEVEGVEYRSSRYHFAGIASSGRSGKEAIVRRYPAGSSARCYVNPRDPAEAVLFRGVTVDLWFGLLPLVFVGVGLGGLVYVRRSQLRESGRLRGSEDGAVHRSGRGVAVERGADGPAVLRSGKSRWIGAAGITLATLFWNGILSIFLVHVIKGFQRGRPEWVMTIFLIPFGLVGLLMIVGCIRAFLRIFAPAVSLRLSTGRPVLGSPFELQWEVRGSLAAVRHLRIVLEGREEATYQRGTSSVTDRWVFAEVAVVDTRAATEMRSGFRRVTVPAESMPTFASDHNKIAWALVAKGDIARWPDIEDRFDLVVNPPSVA